MSTTVNLFKNVYTKQQFEKVVDTSFPVDLTALTASVTLPTVDEFFTYYYALFYEIPKTGPQSHTTLVETSLNYIGPQSNPEVDALLQEVNQLRQTVLNQQQTIYSLTVSGSNG